MTNTAEMKPVAPAHVSRILNRVHTKATYRSVGYTEGFSVHEGPDGTARLEAHDTRYGYGALERRDIRAAMLTRWAATLTREGFTVSEPDEWCHFVTVSR